MAASGEISVPSATTASMITPNVIPTSTDASATSRTNISSLPSSRPNVPLSSSSSSQLSSSTTAKVKTSVPTVGWDDLDLPRFYAAGFLAHLSARSILYPLQVVKTRQQTASAFGEKSYSGVGAAMRAIIRNEGIRSLWRGFGPSIAGAVTGAPYITALELSKKHYILNMHRVGITNPNIAYSVSSLLAGGTASAATMVFTVPLEIISQRQQVERNAASRRSAIQIVRSLLATSGVRGLWRGMPMAFMTQAPGSAITWGSYESLKRITYPLFESQSAEFRDYLLAPLCAGAAGSFSAVVMTPLDTLRTRQQVQERAGTTLLSTWKDLIKQNGYRGLMAGAMPRVYSMGPSAMCMLSLFDVLKRFAAKPDSSLPIPTLT